MLGFVILEPFTLGFKPNSVEPELFVPVPVVSMTVGTVLELGVISVPSMLFLSRVIDFVLSAVILEPLVSGSRAGSLICPLQDNKSPPTRITKAILDFKSVFIILFLKLYTFTKVKSQKSKMYQNSKQYLYNTLLVVS